MKGLLRAMTVIPFLGGCATLGDMSTEEKVWHGLNVVDGAQTAGRCRGVVEMNPLLGKNPSDAEVAAFTVGMSALYHYLHKWIAENEPGGLKVFEYVTIGAKILVIGHNANVAREEC